MGISLLIKYEGDNSLFIWKYPKEDFNCLTNIIVNESQEAIFVKDGKIMDVLGPGRYRLDAENIPILTRALNLFTGISIIHCQVYYVNKTIQMGMYWGTDSRVRFVEPILSLPVEMGASGEMYMQVTDSVKLLTKVVGTMKGIAWDKQGKELSLSIQSAFRPVISNAVRTTLPSAIRQGKIDILEIDEHLQELSEAMLSAIYSSFSLFGLDVVKFYVTTVTLPEDDPNYIKLKELHTASLLKREAEVKAEIESIRAAGKAKITAAEREIELERQKTETEVIKHESERKVISAGAQAEAARKTGLAEAEVMKAQGYNKKDVFQTEVQKAYAESLGNISVSGGEAAGGNGVMGNVLGLGVGIAAAQAMSRPVREMIHGMDIGGEEQTNAIKPRIRCPKCGNELPEKAKFCLECGTKIERSNTVVCPYCGSDTPKGKFCMECGMPLERMCPVCNNTLPPTAKFCPVCGTKMNA